MPAQATAYPRVRTADLQPFSRDGLQVFNFSDLQAATGFELREGRLAVSMLTTLCLLVRTNAQPFSKPVYALTEPGLALVKRSHMTASAALTIPHPAQLMRDASSRGRFGIVELTTSTQAIEGSLVGSVEAVAVVQGKRDLGRALVALRKQLEQACAMPVWLTLEWRR